jgi:hypothetical protein
VGTYGFYDVRKDNEPAPMHEIVFWVYNSVEVRGGEVGFAFDETPIESVTIARGGDLPEGGRLDVDESPGTAACDPDADLGGLTGTRTVAWTHAADGSTSFEPGWHELFRVSWEPADGVAHGTPVPFKFVECLTGLQADGAPVRNRVTIASGLSRNVISHDAERAINVDRSFRRGDVNDDGLFDFSDAVLLLTCAFLGEGCTECPDASDANDDGAVDVSDAVYLITWRFGDTAPPPAPFPDCGDDPTGDGLGECMPGSCAPSAP